AEAYFHPFRPGRAELRIEAGGQLADHVFCTSAGYSPDYCRFLLQPGHVTQSNRMARPELEAEEVLERPGETRPPFVGADSSEVHAIHQDVPLVGWVEPAQQLHQRAFAGAVLTDNGHDRAGLQFQADIIKGATLRARIGEGHVFEADALRESVG